jgi:hypothetical protein
MPDRREEILAHVNDANYRPVKPKVIAKKLGAVDHDASEAVRKQIKRLVKDGLLAFGPSHLVYPIANLKNIPAPSPTEGRAGGGGGGGGARRVQVPIRALGHSPLPLPLSVKERGAEQLRNAIAITSTSSARSAARKADSASFGPRARCARPAATPISSSPPSTRTTPPTAIP